MFGSSGNDGLKRLYPAMDIVGQGVKGASSILLDGRKLSSSRMLISVSSRIAHEVGNAALAAMRIGTAQFLLVHLPRGSRSLPRPDR